MKDDNSLWKNLVALAFLTALWTGFLLASRWLWLRLDAFGPFERSSLFVIPGFVMIGLGIGWLERFLPVHGVIIGTLGRIILAFSPKSIFGHSLCSLRNEWHEKGEESEHYKSYTRTLDPVDRQDFDKRHRFSQWMVADVVKKYENNVQGLAYLGAGILILFIGLRGLQIIGKNDPLFIVLPLEIEFTIISLLGLLIFYKPDESTRVRVDVTGSFPTEDIRNLTREVHEAKQELAAEKTLVVHIKKTGGA
jgi:hypothetical protein